MAFEVFVYRDLKPANATSYLLLIYMDDNNAAGCEGGTAQRDHAGQLRDA
jgi:hypothetical protein